MRLRHFWVAAMLFAAVIGIAAFVSLPLRATLTNLTGYCGDVEPQLDRISGAERFAYRSTAERTLWLHILHPQEERRSGSAIILYFGGGWREGSVAALERFGRALLNDGHVVILSDYRVRCRDNTSISDSVEDAREAYAWVRQNAEKLQIDSAKIVLGGESAGGQLAIMSALGPVGHDLPAALILFNPVVDLEPLASQLWISGEDAKAQSPISKPLNRLPHTLVFHGTADSRVPIETVGRFCAKAALAGRNCTVEEYAGFGHGFLHSRQPIDGSDETPFDRTVQKVRHFLLTRLETPEIPGNIHHSGDNAGS